MIITIAIFIVGLILLLVGSDKTINSALHVGHMFKISPLIMGVVVLAIGTSLPEAAASVIAAMEGHGDVVTGNVIGSALIQITFILGIVALINPIKARRKEVLLIGGSAIIASILAVLVAEKGFITRADSILLLAALGFLLYINQRFAKKEFELQTFKDGKKHIFILILAMIAVVIGADLVVNSAIEISRIFGVSEFLIALLIIGPGGSLPELAVSLIALRKKNFDLSVGNLLGSNIVDTTFSLAIGPLIAPIVFDAEIVKFTGWYMIFASMIVVGLFAYRQRVDRKTGLFYMLLYLVIVFLGILKLTGFEF